MADEGKPMSRGLKVLLFGSLALNLLIAGVVAGVFMSGGPGKKDRADRADAGAFVLVRALPREARAELRERFATKRAEQSTSSNRKSPLKEDILVSLRAEPFDPAAFAELVTSQTRYFAERGRLGQEALVEQVSEMTDDERKTYADRVEEVFSRRHDLRDGRERRRR